MAKRPPAILTANWDNLRQLHGTEKRLWGLTRDGFIIHDVGINHTLVPEFVNLAYEVEQDHGEQIAMASGIFGIPAPILAATICAESVNDPAAIRQEPHDRSYGLCQLLTGTAYNVGRVIGWPKKDVKDTCLPMSWYMPTKPKKDWLDWMVFLRNPAVNIALCAAYFMIMANRHKHWNKDPIMLYASFNAGGAYHSDSIPWGLHSTPAALDAFRNYYNDYVRDVVNG